MPHISELKSSECHYAVAANSVMYLFILVGTYNLCVLNESHRDPQDRVLEPRLDIFARDHLSCYLDAILSLKGHFVEINSYCQNANDPNFEFCNPVMFN